MVFTFPDTSGIHTRTKQQEKKKEENWENEQVLTFWSATPAVSQSEVSESRHFSSKDRPPTARREQSAGRRGEATAHLGGEPLSVGASDIH